MKPRNDLAVAEEHEQHSPIKLPALFKARPAKLAPSAEWSQFLQACHTAQGALVAEADRAEEARITTTDSIEQFSAAGIRIEALRKEAKDIGFLIKPAEKALVEALDREKADHEAQEQATCRGSLQGAAVVAERMDQRRIAEISDIRELLQHIDGALAHAGANRGQLQARIEEGLGRYLSVTAEAMKPLSFPGIARIAEFAFSANPVHRQGNTDDLSFASAFKRLAGDDPAPDDDPPKRAA